MPKYIITKEVEADTITQALKLEVKADVKSIYLETPPREPIGFRAK